MLLSQLYTQKIIGRYIDYLSDVQKRRDKKKHKIRPPMLEIGASVLSMALLFC